MAWYRKARKRRAPKHTGKADKCRTKWCRNRRAKKVTRRRNAAGRIIEYHSFLPVCWKCKSRQLKQRHPETYVLNLLRRSAKSRGLPFDITLAEFRWFCLRTGYLEKRGKAPGALTIDRIDADKGYHIWNIQVLSHAENSEKGHGVPGKDYRQNERRPTYYDYAGAEPVTVDADQPF
jgi:hypothetical protein